MLERTHFAARCFSNEFVRYRARYYFNETKELLARHKLLTAFFVCLLAPGLEHIQAIGIPFYTLVSPDDSLKTKLIYLLSVIFFLLAMTRAQLSFIKGGSFREYLHTLHIPGQTHKKIDFIILLLSLNVVWLAIFFGGVNIRHHSGAPLFISSQYCLYTAAICALITLLFNDLYRKTGNGIMLFSALVLVVFISKQERWFLNYGVACYVFILSAAIIWTVSPYLSKHSYWFKTASPDVSHGFNYSCSLKKYFIIQLAVYRKNKASFLGKFIFCFALSILVLKALSSSQAVDNREGIVLIVINAQLYILSTLFIFFAQEKSTYALFHKIVPYQRLIQPVKEVFIVWCGFMLVLLPMALSLKNSLLWWVVLFVINAVVLGLNRILYAQSLRFCLFTSWLNTVGGCVVHYIVKGACFG